MLSFFSVHSTCFTKSDKVISVNPLSEITRRVYKYHSQCYMDNTVSGTCMQVPNETGSGDRRSKSPLRSVGMPYSLQMFNGKFS